MGDTTRMKMPDSSITVEEMHEFGYTYEKMLPIRKETALKLFAKGLEVYRLYEDDTEGAVESEDEMNMHCGLFGIEIDVWLGCLDSLDIDLEEIDFDTSQKMNRVYLSFDTAVAGYEKYCLYAGTKCYINNLPFQIMCERGEISFEAECVCLSAHFRTSERRLRLISGEKIAIVLSNKCDTRRFEYTIPEKIRQQSFIVNERRKKNG